MLAADPFPFFFIVSIAVLVTQAFGMKPRIGTREEK